MAYSFPVLIRDFRLIVNMEENDVIRFELRSRPPDKDINKEKIVGRLRLKGGFDSYGQDFHDWLTKHAGRFAAGILYSRTAPQVLHRQQIVRYSRTLQRTGGRRGKQPKSA